MCNISQSKLWCCVAFLDIVYFNNINSKDSMDVFEFGKSSCGLSLTAYRREQGLKRVLLLAGVHGDEWEGVFVAKQILLESVKSDLNVDLTIVPVLNLDGFLRGTRRNVNDIDLNRNLLTLDWSSDGIDERFYAGKEANSEIENKSLISYIEEWGVEFIISLHSWKHALMNVNGDCLEEAEAAKEYNFLDIKGDIGYSTPGCLGTYGVERRIPVITYEIDRGLFSRSEMLKHVLAIKSAISTFGGK